MKKWRCGNLVITFRIVQDLVTSEMELVIVNETGPLLYVELNGKSLNCSCSAGLKAKTDLYQHLRSFKLGRWTYWISRASNEDPCS